MLFCVTEPITFYSSSKFNSIVSSSSLTSKSSMDNEGFEIVNRDLGIGELLARNDSYHYINHKITNKYINNSINSINSINSMNLSLDNAENISLIWKCNDFEKYKIGNDFYLLNDRNTLSNIQSWKRLSQQEQQLLTNIFIFSINNQQTPFEESNSNVDNIVIGTKKPETRENDQSHNKSIAKNNVLNTRQKSPKTEKAEKTENSGNRSEPCQLPEIFSIINVLFTISSFLSVFTMAKMRRISKYFSNQFAFSFTFDKENNLFFEYGNLRIKKLIQAQICDKLENIVLFACQWQNRDCYDMIFKPQTETAMKPINSETRGKTWLTRVVMDEEVIKAAPRLGKVIPGMNELRAVCQGSAPLALIGNELPKLIKNHLFDSGDKYGIAAMECLILGYLYDIKPLKQMVLSMLKNNGLNGCKYTRKLGTFNTLAKQASLGEYMTRYDEESKHYRVADRLIYLWEQLLMENYPMYWGLSSYHFYNETEVTGKQNFFGDLAMKGSFETYELFLENFDSKECDTPGKVLSKLENNDSWCIDGLLVSISLFQRYDLLTKKYLNCNWYRVYPAFQVLYFAINPSELENWKNRIKTKLMMPINKKEEFEFDLFSNARYKVFKRLKFIASLMFSSQFCNSLRIQSGYIERISPLFYQNFQAFVRESFDSFEYFQSKWKLNEMNECKDNLESQKSIYEDYRSILQCIFTYFAGYLDWDDEANSTDVKSAILSCDFTKCNSYIDCQPENGEELQALHKIITNIRITTMDIVPSLVTKRNSNAQEESSLELLQNIWEIARA